MATGHVILPGGYVMGPRRRVEVMMSARRIAASTGAAPQPPKSKAREDTALSVDEAFARVRERAAMVDPEG
eukprot:2866106-Rhodomonas_salina.1